MSSKWALFGGVWRPNGWARRETSCRAEVGERRISAAHRATSQSLVPSRLCASTMLHVGLHALHSQSFRPGAGRFAV